MGKLRVFISYDWQNLDERNSVLVALHGAPIEAVFDESGIKQGSNVWESISNLLNSSHCVLAILTKQSVCNPNVIEELTRAHERGMEIISLCSRETAGGKLPSFLRPALRIEYSDAREIGNLMNAKAIPQLLQFKDEMEQVVQPRRRFRAIFNALDDIDRTMHKFRRRLADAILANAEDELDLASDNYSINLGLEQNFLIRAKPIFANADAVYATSLDAISTFWLSDTLRETAHDYIRSQSPQTIRLFVFHDAAAAHAHVQVIDFHSQVYGATGAVLLCSFDTYKCLMKSIGADVPNVYDTDFAFIETDAIRLLARLDGARLHFRVLSSDKPDPFFPVRPDKFCAVLRALANTPPGDVGHVVPGAAKGPVLRWSSAFVQDRAVWAQRLKEVFEAQNVSGAYIHQVTLRAGIKLEDVVAVRNELLAMRVSGEAPFDDLWLGSRFLVGVQDAVYGGKMETGADDDTQYCLLLTFANKDNLMSYLASRDHSRVRKQLYSCFSDEIRQLYEEADSLLKEGVNTATVFERIEEAARPYFNRRAYAGTERIDDIVKVPHRRFVE